MSTRDHHSPGPADVVVAVGDDGSLIVNGTHAVTGSFDRASFNVSFSVAPGEHDVDWSLANVTENVGTAIEQATGASLNDGAPTIQLMEAGLYSVLFSASADYSDWTYLQVICQMDNANTGMSLVFNLDPTNPPTVPFPAFPLSAAYYFTAGALTISGNHDASAPVAVTVNLAIQRLS